VRLSGAQAIVRGLIEQGVDTVFGYPGGAVLPLYDALYEHRDTIAHYLTAHEQGAAHAADGYARATGKAGVVFATSGPGSTNLVTGIAAAFMDSVPVIAVTGNVGSTFIGKDSFQEVYTTGITLPITKHNFFVQDAEELPAVLREAFAIAMGGRKGPVLIDVTKDAQAAFCEWKTGEAGAGEAATQTDVSADDLDAVLTALAASTRPLVLFGGGVISADASEELREFLHMLQVPAAHSIMGIGALEPDDALDVGLVGMHGRLSGNRALAEADLVVAMGFRFSDRVALDREHWASQAHIVHIDIDPSEIDKNIGADRAVIGDIRAVLQALLGRMRLYGTPCPDTAPWRTLIASWRAKDYRPAEDGTALRPHQIIGAIAEVAGPDAILTTDVGQHQIWAAQYSRQGRPRSFLTSGGLGAMGFGYGAAIGAQIGAGGIGADKGAGRRPVIHITGDGSFHMNLNEACTAVSYRLPIVSVIFNNRALGMVRQWQRSFYDAHYCATTLDRATDYVKVAEGFGAEGIRTTTIAEFKAALVHALAACGPVWIECVIDRDEQVLPMIPVGNGVDDVVLN
jgi:acetolactate synthase-1/2/3 large subunit